MLDGGEAEGGDRDLAKAGISGKARTGAARRRSGDGWSMAEAARSGDSRLDLT